MEYCFWHSSHPRTIELPYANRFDIDLAELYQISRTENNTGTSKHELLLSFIREGVRKNLAAPQPPIVEEHYPKIDLVLGIVCAPWVRDSIENRIKDRKYVNRHIFYIFKDALEGAVSDVNLIMYVNEFGLRMDHIYPEVKEIHKMYPHIPIYIDVGIVEDMFKVGFYGGRFSGSAVKELMDCNVIGYSQGVCTPEWLTSKELPKVIAERDTKLMRRYFSSCSHQRFFPNLQEKLSSMPR